MNEPPERIFVDPRVARTMPQELYETSVAYVRQDIAERAAQMAVDRSQPDEIIIQITAGHESIGSVSMPAAIALTNHGRIFIQETGNGDRWSEIQSPLKEQNQIST